MATVTSNGEHLTVDREAFDDAMTQLGALAAFADVVFADGGDGQSFMLEKLLTVRRNLVVAAGFSHYPDADDYIRDEQLDKEWELADELVREWVSSVTAGLTRGRSTLRGDLETQRNRA